MLALKRLRPIANGRRIFLLCFILANIFALSAHGQFGIINTIAGTGVPGYTGDGAQATVAELSFPLGLWVDPVGNVYVADSGNNTVRKITPAGVISTIAGTGVPGYSGDGGPAVIAKLNQPTSVYGDAAGNIFIADYNNNAIREISGGIIRTVVGIPPAPGFSGDGGPATDAVLTYPYGLWVDASGNIIFTDLGNYRVREVSGATGIINTISGGTFTSYCCDGVPAVGGSFNFPSGLCENPSGIIYFCTPLGDARVRKIDLAGIINTEMGDGTNGSSGDCGPDTLAEINQPQGVASDAAGNIYLASAGDGRIRVVEGATDIIHTAAGDGSLAFSGDGGSPMFAGMDPYGVFVDIAGNIYISGNSRVRKISIARHNDTVTTICPGDSVVLGSLINALDSLKWSNGATTSSITVYTPGIYWVTTYECSYVSHDTFYVAGCANPISNSPVCPGDTLKLQSVGDSTGATYLWYGPGMFTSTLQNPVIPLLPPADSGVYHVVKTLFGIVDSATIDIVVKPLPVVTSGSNSPVCSGTGNTVMLTSAPGNPGETFAWTGPNGFSSTLQNPILPSPSVTDQGLYKVITTWSSCKDSTSIFVVVDSTPAMPAISSNAPICSQRDTLKLTSRDATFGVTFSWIGPLGFASLLQNPAILPDVHVPASGTYSVTVTLSTGGLACSAQNALAVVIDSTPYLPVLGSNSPVCSGSPLLLTASSTMASNYSWTGSHLFTSVLQNPTINPAATTVSGSYSVSAAIIYPGIPGGCISDTATLAVVVDSTPATPVVSSNSPGPPGPELCDGDRLLLTAIDTTAGITYLWSGPDGFTSTNANPIIPHVSDLTVGSYTVTVSLDECSVTGITSVTVTTTPPLTVTNNGPVCTGIQDTLFLQAASTPGATFSWAGPYTFSSGNQNPYRTPVIMEYSGVYQVTAFLGGCASGVVNDTVIVRQTPAPPIVPWLTYCQFYKAPPLQAMGDSILWYPTDAPGDTGVLTPPVPPTSNTGATWYYTSQTLMGCTSYLDSIKVVVNPKPLVVVSNDTAICTNDSVMLTALDSDPIAYYHWAPYLYITDSSSPSIIVKPQTNVVYTVVATNQFDCTDTAYTTVSVLAQALLDLGDSVTLNPGQSYQINPLTNCSSFSWFPPSGLSNANISNPVASPELSTIYIVLGETSWGCFTTDSISIYVNTESLLVLPNAFTPGNGPDNEFKIVKIGDATLNYFRIFDRWGVKVFETADKNQGWDGTYKGAPQPFGVYVYEVSAETGVGTEFIKHGNVTLIR